MWICSGDIRDQTRKLSEIALNFRRFLSSQILGGEACPNVVPTLAPCLAASGVGKFSGVTPASAKVIVAHTLNFKPNFTFYMFALKFFGGTPVPVRCVR